MKEKVGSQLRPITVKVSFFQNPSAPLKLLEDAVSLRQPISPKCSLDLYGQIPASRQAPPTGCRLLTETEQPVSKHLRLGCSGRWAPHPSRATLFFYPCQPPTSGHHVCFPSPPSPPSLPSGCITCISHKTWSVMVSTWWNPKDTFLFFCSASQMPSSQLDTRTFWSDSGLLDSFTPHPDVSPCPGHTLLFPLLAQPALPGC